MSLFPISQNMSVFLMGPQEAQTGQSCQSLLSAEQFQQELPTELHLQPLPLHFSVHHLPADSFVPKNTYRFVTERGRKSNL